MKLDVEAAGALLDYLRGLANLKARSVADEQELKEWQDEVNRLWLMIRAFPSACELLPESLWHFLADADIRFREGRPVSRFESGLERQLEEAADQAMASVNADRTR